MPIFTGTPGDDTLLGTPDPDEIYGLEGNDGLLGLAGNDLLEGGEGHDFLRGDEDNDILRGGDGDDFLNGGVGDDVLEGGAGLDRAAYSTGAIAGVSVDLRIVGVAQDTGSQGLDLLTGIEHVSGTRFDDVLHGDDGDNWVWGGSDGSGITGNDTLSGHGGNDLIWVGTGNHSADGGTGADTLSLFGNRTDITAAGVTVSLLLQGAAQDTEQGMMILNGFENLSGSIHDDSLTGDSGNNVLAGDFGNDLLVGGGGGDTLYGDGAITIESHGTGTSGPIVTYSDVSTLPFATDPPGDDILEGGGGDDTLDGGGGSDTARYAGASGGVFVSLAGGFADELDAGAGIGTDTLLNIENASGSAFDDVLIGSGGDNILSGEDGLDLLTAGAGNDTLLGGNGDDLLRGQADDDLLDGGAGLDRASYAVGATAGVSVDLRIDGVAQDTVGQGFDTLISIEHVTGSRFDDILHGDEGDNWIWSGTDGSGVTGNDTLSGHDGNDLIWVGNGGHFARGGVGIDTLALTGLSGDITAAGVTASLALQGAVQDTEQGMMDLNEFENLSGSIFDDVLGGDNGDNLLAGDSGNDSLGGGKGNDTLLGDGRVAPANGVGGGPINFYADVADLPPTTPGGIAGGNDTLDGGKGDDTLIGGGGDDVLTGGQGLDIFVFGPGDGDDVITDFRRNADTIRFESIAGVDDFSDLTLTRVGGDTLITWGTADSILVEGMRPGHLGAGDFSFG